MFLIRDLNTKKVKEQEERFLNIENISFFFETEKEIYGIDQWMFSSILKIQNHLPLNNKFYFSKWNKNIEYLYLNTKTNIQFIETEINENFKKAFFLKDVFLLKNIIRNFDSNLIYSHLLFVLSFLSKKDYKINTEKINLAINTNIVSSSQLLNFLILIYVNKEDE